MSKQWAEKAVSQLEGETAKISLLGLQVEDLRRVNALAAYWDTLGWAYFRNPDLAAGERYLHAAWILSQDPVVGDHLGKLYESEGKRQQAAHIYELAHATGSDGTEAAKLYKTLTGRDIEDAMSPSLARRHNRTGSMPMWPGEELSRMRTIKLPTITTKSASAEFFVLLSAGPKVEGSQFISGSDELKNAGQSLSSVNFRAEFPDAGPVRIVRRGVLMCGALGCDFTLLLPHNRPID